MVGTVVPPQQVVVVAAQPQGYAVYPMGSEPSGLLPEANMGRWRYGLFDACCAFGSCFNSWCCACLPAGQISGKLKALGLDAMGHWAVVQIYVALYVLDIILETTVGIDMNVHLIFLTFVLFKARTQIRVKMGIPGSPMEDCCIACWCQPCALQQMIGQIWHHPSSTPGCAVNDHVATLP